MKLRPILTVAAVICMAVLLFLPADVSAAELDDIGTTCLESPLQDCDVYTAGFLNAADFSNGAGSPMFAWQTQVGFTATDGVIGGFVLYQYDGKGWSLLDSGFDGFYEIPRLSADGLLHIPGYSQGTGAFNVDRLYQWGNLGNTSSEGWVSVNLDGWFGDIGTKLPAGLEIWKGVEYDFSDAWSGLVARTSLWRAEDGNCCPSGGSALILFKIEDNQLVATDVTYTPPAKTK